MIFEIVCGIAAMIFAAFSIILSVYNRAKDSNNDIDERIIKLNQARNEMELCEYNNNYSYDFYITTQKRYYNFLSVLDDICKSFSCEQIAQSDAFYDLKDIDTFILSGMLGIDLPDCRYIKKKIHKFKKKGWHYYDRERS